MVIFINGAFGIGKTTVARLLARRLKGSALFDPEPLGLALARVATVLPLKHRTDDFQDLVSWRKTCARVIRTALWLRPTIIVPMAFSNRAYLDDVVSPLRSRGIHTLHFCLTAPHRVVLERLQSREGRRGPSAWQLRRSEECCIAHEAPDFGEHIAAESRTAEELAVDLVQRTCRAIEESRAHPVA